MHVGLGEADEAFQCLGVVADEHEVRLELIHRHELEALGEELVGLELVEAEEVEAADLLVEVVDEGLIADELEEGGAGGQLEQVDEEEGALQVVVVQRGGDVEQLEEEPLALEVERHLDALVHES